MNYRTTRNTLLTMTAGLLALCIGGCSSPNDNAEMAEQVARNWVESHIDDVSDKLATVVSNDYPAIGGFVVKMALKQGLDWAYTADRVDRDRWNVVARARVNFNIPVVNTKIDISGGIPLSVNTSELKVTSFSFDPSSFQYAFGSDSEAKSLPAAASPKVADAQAVKLTTEQAQQLLQLEREVEKNPKNVEAWTSLGNLYFDSDQVEKAIIAYNKSLALAPNNADVLTDLGIMYRRASNPQQAIASFDQAVKANAKHETARLNKGVVLLYDFNDQSGAIAAWQELVNLNPMATALNGQLVSEIIKDLKEKKKGM